MRNVWKPVDKLLIIIYTTFTMSFTYKPKKRKRAKSHGFLVRSKTPGGRRVLKRRRTKGRKKVAI